MFGLFGKKNKGLNVIDKIWMTEKAKFNACLDMKKSNPDIVFVAWFEEMRSKLEAFFLENNLEEQIYLADRMSTVQESKDLIFVEHHPLAAEEQRKATELGRDQITILSSMSEPIFQLFGADRIIEMMQKMGMAENEMIEHSLVSDSIKRAQQNIASKSLINTSARSQGDWLSSAGIQNQSL